MKDLSIISVNWKSVDYLLKCLATIKEHVRDIDYEVIVVDTGATDNSADILKQEFPDTLLIRTADNLGFSRANNWGFEKSSGRVILFLNPDTEVIGSAIQTMYSRLQSLPDAGVIGCKLLNTDLSVQTTSIQRFPTILNQVFGVEKLRLLWPQCPLWRLKPLFEETKAPVRVDTVSGASLMIKREVFEKIERFSEEYFMYAEDIELCYKVRQAGFRTYYTGEVTILHHGGGSSQRQRVNQWAITMQRRAMLQYFQSTRGRIYATCYRATMAAGALLRLLALVPLRCVGNLVVSKENVDYSFGKWLAVFKWAAGLERTSR